jgi:hypothetical protein
MNCRITGRACGNRPMAKKPDSEKSISTHTDTTSPSVTVRLELATLTITSALERNACKCNNINSLEAIALPLHLTTVNLGQKQKMGYVEQTPSSKEIHFCNSDN